MYHSLKSIGSFVTNSEKDNVLLSPTPPCMNNRLYHLPWIAGNPSPPKWRRRCVSMCVLCVVCEVREMHGLRGKGETDHLGWRKPTNGPIAVPISKDTRRGSNQVDPGYCAALLTPQKQIYERQKTSIQKWRLTMKMTNKIKCRERQQLSDYNEVQYGYLWV